MSSGLNYAKAKRDNRARTAVHQHPADHDDDQIPRPLGHGWRTTYPAEFPVTVTKVKPDTGRACA